MAGEITLRLDGRELQVVELVEPAVSVTLEVPSAPRLVQVQQYNVTVQATVAQGMTGPKGDPGSGADLFRTYEYVAVEDGPLLLQLPSPVDKWYVLFINGLRQMRSFYMISGASVTLPASMGILEGDTIALEYATVPEAED